MQPQNWSSNLAYSIASRLLKNVLAFVAIALQL